MLGRAKPVIKIAVLDDGIDLGMSQNIQIAKGESFYDQSTTGRNSGANGGRPRGFKDYFTEPGPHGTQMAHCIMRMCHDADLYVARLDDRPGLSNCGKFTIASASEVCQNLHWC